MGRFGFWSVTSFCLYCATALVQAFLTLCDYHLPFATGTPCCVSLYVEILLALRLESDILR